VNIHKTAKTTPKMRALIVARRQAGENAGLIASALGVSVVTVNKWLAWHAVEGAAGLVDRSSRPHRCRPVRRTCNGARWRPCVAPAKRVDWFNNRRLLEPSGNIPPAEAEEAFHANLNTLDMVA